MNLIDPTQNIFSTKCLAEREVKRVDNANHATSQANSIIITLCDHVAAQDREITRLREALEELKKKALDILIGSSDGPFTKYGEGYSDAYDEIQSLIEKALRQEET